MNWLLGLMLLLFWAIGLSFLAYAVKLLRLRKESRAWPRVECSLLDYGMEEERDSDGDLMWRVRVRYRYAVAGREFTGDRLAFGYDASNDQARHERIRKTLEALSRPTVRYQPDNPGVSVLLPDANSGGAQILLAFAVFWLFITTMVTFAWVNAGAPGTFHQVQDE